MSINLLYKIIQKKKVWIDIWIWNDMWLSNDMSMSINAWVNYSFKNKSFLLFKLASGNAKRVIFKITIHWLFTLHLHHSTEDKMKKREKNNCTLSMLKALSFPHP